MPLLISLVIAAVATYLSLNTTEEILKVASLLIVIICLLLSFVFAPLLIKVLIVGIFLVIPTIPKKS
ncbi:hypothetical protein [Moorena sp. SIO2C4]|uniref:Uncharacterized protein n=1 Tax=Moorena producens 3L TaxID=489825 RepID=F4Y3N0_9CYAN|nr:hypothetical protein [Moorena sp. SIO2C4]EGJ28706.1 hypothetical protein LYNGBM3L_72770 [Moorena producens 3L]NER87177.1 hypothetical protein [Moorena sp. SIO3A2]OLT63901.1 hypothetical protein BI334_01645 [Moorena producens 3L]